MKKTSKIVAVVLAALLVVAAVVVLAACNGGDNAAYGLVHNKGYVGKATVKMAGGKVVEATLDEACFPTQVTAKEADGDYTVDVEKTNNAGTVHTFYYKTVKWEGVTAVYDAADGYKVGDKKLVDFFADEANCKVYFEAVAANGITVVTSAGEKTDIMNAASLLKSQNGYWGTPAEKALGWKANKDATINYVIENGFDGFEGIEKTSKDNGTIVDHSSTNAKLDNEVVDKNGVATGATWTDFMDYFNLLKAAAGK